MTQPHITFERPLLDDIAARLDLRVPNREATEAIVRAIEVAAGEQLEVVADLATGVGKTYIGAALIDYLAEQGVRHFLIVTPGRTIQDKTVANYTPGHPKSVTGGMDHVPVVVTAEDFATGRVRTAIEDEDRVKLFVFNVQQLIRPAANLTRRTRRFQEWLGLDLYRYLQDRDDLVVIADEHHVYQERARAFSDAVRELTPLALVGLTATPDRSSLDKVVYAYPLARAIADRLVKTPVLVGRRDDRTDVETQLRDGLVLLDAKQRAIDEWCRVTGEAPVNAVMFIVADTIDNANAVAEVMRRPGFFPYDYEDRVNVIHSDAPDDALARLDRIEDPASPARAIVSVSMLKEGWDVKNIYVICSLRPSISDALTEQTLGRGLRLPWGHYTGIELLDTVEVLSHERYERILARAGTLIEGLVGVRAVQGIDVTTPVTPAPFEALVLDTQEEGEVAAGVAAAAVGSVPVATWPVAPITDTGAAPGFLVAAAEDRVVQAAAEVAAVAQPVAPREGVVIEIPAVVRVIHGRNFALADIADEDFTRLGTTLAAQPDEVFERRLLAVEADATAPTGYRLVPRETTDRITAWAPVMPAGRFRTVVREAILAFDEVPQDRASIGAVTRLVDALVRGAGAEAAEPRLGLFVNTAIDGARAIIRATYRAAPARIDERIEARVFAPLRLNTRPIDANRFGEFTRRAAYSGFGKSQFELDWFDSSKERDLANVLDGAEAITAWTRIQRGEHVIEWDGGRYSPDFYARHAAGGNWLLEVKADRDLDDVLVVAKRAAAERWARRVSDEGTFGTWRYVLVSETAIHNAHGSWGVLLAQAGAG
ncbi:MAG TPA: DEAD/DEAH box helicase family protein [Propionicimonas sp.]